jgi:hypothetical protein
MGSEYGCESKGALALFWITNSVWRFVVSTYSASVRGESVFMLIYVCSFTCAMQAARTGKMNCLAWEVFHCLSVSRDTGLLID